MIVNPDKFQSIILDEKSSDLYLNENIATDNENIKVVSNVKILKC